MLLYKPPAYAGLQLMGCFTKEKDWEHLGEGKGRNGSASLGEKVGGIFFFSAELYLVVCCSNMVALCENRKKKCPRSLKSSVDKFCLLFSVLLL